MQGTTVEAMDKALTLQLKRKCSYPYTCGDGMADVQIPCPSGSTSSSQYFMGREPLPVSRLKMPIGMNLRCISMRRIEFRKCRL